MMCKRCGHEWITRIVELPKCCPGCKSPYWNRERIVRPLKAVRTKRETIAQKLGIDKIEPGQSIDLRYPILPDRTFDTYILSSWIRSVDHYRRRTGRQVFSEQVKKDNMTYLRIYRRV